MTTLAEAAHAVAGAAVAYTPAIINAVLKQPAPGSRWVPVRKVVAIAALHVGRALNAKRVGVPPKVLERAHYVEAPRAAAPKAVGLITAPAQAVASALDPRSFGRMLDELPSASRTLTAEQAAMLHAMKVAVGLTTSDVSASFGLPMPAASAATASAPAATGNTTASTGMKTMSFFNEVEEAWTFAKSIFGGVQEASIAGDISSLIGKVGAAGSTLVGVASFATMALPTAMQATAKTIIQDLTAALGTLNSASPATTFTGLLNTAAALVQSVPMGTEDKKHAVAVLTGLTVAVTALQAAVGANDNASTSTTVAAA